MKPLVPLTRGQVGLLGWGRDDRTCTFSDVGGSLPSRGAGHSPEESCLQATNKPPF